MNKYENLRKRSEILKSQKPEVHERLKEMLNQLGHLAEYDKISLQTERFKRFLIPGFSIPSKDFYLNQFNKNLIDSSEYIKLVSSSSGYACVDVQKYGITIGNGSKTHHIASGPGYKRLIGDIFTKEEFKNFISDPLGIPFDNSSLGKSPGINYPDRSNPKKYKRSIKDLIKKAVNWWRY